MFSKNYSFNKYVLVSQPRSGLVVSGEVVNSTVRFEMQSAMFKMLSIDIQDDLVALEDSEVFSLHFVSLFPAANILFGPEAVVTIQDDDGNINQTVVVCVYCT